jgi:hypothetical protein
MPPFLLLEVALMFTSIDYASISNKSQILSRKASHYNVKNENLT